MWRRARPCESHTHESYDPNQPYQPYQPHQSNEAYDSNESNKSHESGQYTDSEIGLSIGACLVALHVIASEGLTQHHCADSLFTDRQLFVTMHQ